MPYLTIALGHKRPLFQAWRIAFFFPAIAHIVMAVLILFFGQVTSSNLITYCFLWLTSHSCLSSRTACQHSCYLQFKACSKRLCPSGGCMCCWVCCRAASDLEQSAVLKLLRSLQDLPDGNFKELQKSGRKQKAKLGRSSVSVLLNYRMWCLAAVYAYSFGVELALDNALGKAHLLLTAPRQVAALDMSRKFVVWPVQASATSPCTFPVACAL